MSFGRSTFSPMLGMQLNVTSKEHLHHHHHHHHHEALLSVGGGNKIPAVLTHKELVCVRHTHTHTHARCYSQILTKETNINRQVAE